MNTAVPSPRTRRLFPRSAGGGSARPSRRSSRGRASRRAAGASPTDIACRAGGESRLMRGAVFEKVGVNVSHVWGVLPPEVARAGAPARRESDGRFVACGISLVAHMCNPYVPARAPEPALPRHRAAPGSAAARTSRRLSRSRRTRGVPRTRCAAACEAYRPGAYARVQGVVRPLFLPAAPPGAARRRRDLLRRPGERRRGADFAFVRARGRGRSSASIPRIVARRKDTPYDEAARERLLLKRGPLRGVQPGVRPRHPLRLQHRRGPGGLPDEPAARW